MQNQPGEPKHVDLSKIPQVVADYYGNMPHPLVPEVKVRDYEMFENVAADMFESQLESKRPSPEHVAHAFQQLQAMQMTPAEFQHTWAVAKPVSQRLLDREPTMVDIDRLRHSTPHEIHQHYFHSPYPGYEEVTAGQMARHWRAMEPIAKLHGQQLNHETVSRAAIAGWTSDDAHNYFGGKW